LLAAPIRRWCTGSRVLPAVRRHRSVRSAGRRIRQSLRQALSQLQPMAAALPAHGPRDCDKSPCDNGLDHAWTGRAGYSFGLRRDIRGAPPMLARLDRHLPPGPGWVVGYRDRARLKLAAIVQRELVATIAEEAATHAECP
jgi:hypothetical protein